MTTSGLANTNAQFISILKAPVSAGSITMTLLSYGAGGFISTPDQDNNNYGNFDWEDWYASWYIEFQNFAWESWLPNFQEWTDWLAEDDFEGPSMDLSLQLEVVNICATDSEIQVAQKIEQQLINSLSSYSVSPCANPVSFLYSGIPVFSSQTPPPTIRVHRTDHVVTLWSQVAFELQINEDTTGAVFDVNSTTPALCTIPYFINQAEVEGIDLTNNDDEDLTDDQLKSIILKYSNELIARMGSFIVLCTYLNSFIGNDSKSIFTGPTPGYARDPLTIRHKSRGFTSEEDENTDQIIPYPHNLFQWVKQTGELRYRPGSSIVDMKLPWRRDNEVQISIIAGYKFIPLPIQMAIVSLYGIAQLGQSDFKRLRGGGAEIEYDNPSKIIDKVYRSVRAFKSRNT